MMDKKNIYNALAKFQSIVPIIYKDTEAYGYKYADLPNIIEVITPLMNKCGLGYYQSIYYNESADCNILKTIIFETESGEEVSATMKIKENVQLSKMNDYQVLGSAITYYRRYQLSALLGLVTDKDTDVHEAQEGKKTIEDVKKALNGVVSRESFEKVMADFKEFLQNKEIIEICKVLSSKYPRK